MYHISRITFDPIVEVKVDTLNWVIKNVTTKLDTLKLFQINNYYKIYSNEYYMPKQSVVKYYIKDKKTIIIIYILRIVETLVPAAREAARGEASNLKLPDITNNDFLKLLNIGSRDHYNKLFDAEQLKTNWKVQPWEFFGIKEFKEEEWKKWKN